MLLTIYTMKKIRLLFLSLSVAALAGCTADMDKFTERLDDLEARVAALETLCAQMNEDISSMRTVISALEDGLYITDVKNVSGGYRIEFSDGETITIRHGEDGEDGVPGTPGADGQDGYTPVIGVRMDTDGIYYWTLDGEWLLDDQGNKMRVTGENGKDGADGEDGVTPVIGVAQDEDGIYYWTINGEWLLDENGNKVQAQYLDGADSEDLIEDVVVDDMGITFVLSDGSELYIPLYEAITIAFDAEDLLVMEPGSERDIHYTIESRLEDIRIEVLSSSDIRARVVPTDAFTGVINIHTGPSLDEYSKVVVFATNGEKMLMRTIAFEEAGLEIQNEAVKQVPEEGGEISLEFLSNVETQVIIPENAQDWISLVPATKAMEYNAVTLQIEPNPGYYRSAEVSISSLGTYLSLTYTIEQNGEMGVDIDPEAVPEDEIWYVMSDGSVYDIYQTTSTYGHQPFDVKVVSNTYKNGYGVIKFEAPVTEICDFTFGNWASDMTALYLPDCVESIGVGAIYGTGLTTLRIPKNLKQVDSYGLSNKNMQNFTGEHVSPDGKCVIIDGLLCGFAPKGIKEYSVPEGVKIIDAYAFSWSDIEKVILPEGLRYIGGDAFCECKNLKSVTFPSSLDGLHSYAFRGCTSIEGFYGNENFHTSDNKCLIFQQSIPGLPEWSGPWICGFAGHGLSEYTIPDGIVGIENYAFESKTDLISITIPSSVVHVAGYAFYGCTNLETVFGPNVTEDNRAFMYGDAFGPLIARKNLPSEYCIPDNVTLINYQAFVECPEIQTIRMGDQVVEIEGYAFASCQDLKSITLSSGLKLIDGCNIFLGSTNLESIYCRALIPPIYYDEQMSEFPNLKFYVPEQSLSLYQNNVGWSLFKKYFVGYKYDDLAVPDYYMSSDYSMDGTYELLQQSTIGNGIDVVLMGDAYSDRLIADGTYRSVMENTMEQFFSEEPYKSFREYFNVYMVNVVSPNEVYEPDSRTALSTWFGDGTSVGGDDQTVFSYALNAISEDRMDEALIVVMMNRDYYAGTCWMYYPESGDYGNGVSVAYFPTSSDEATFRGLILHEAGGHGFAKLADEYAYEEYGQVPSEEITNCQNLWDFGWYPNIDFTSDPALVNWSEFIADARYQYDGLGVFEGGYTYWTGVWRPTENSIMRYNEGGFNAPSREAIYTRINKLAFGESWQYDYEDFVAYDAVNRRSEPATAPSSVLQRHEPTAPPVIVRKTWREALESSGQPEAHLKSR